jgi:hypothetical protein
MLMAIWKKAFELCIGTGSVCALLFLVPSFAHSQSKPMDQRINLLAPNEPELVAVPLQPNFPLPNGVNNSLDTSVRPYASVLTNKSARSVTALAVRWSITDAMGHTKLRTFLRDSYALPTGRTVPVIPPESDMLITPSGFVNLWSAGAGAAHGVEERSTDSTVISLLADASKITISIDTAIFENGKVVGPGESKYVEYIRDRKAAAHGLVVQVRDAVANQKDIPALLTSLIPPLQVTPENWFLFWTGQHARRLLQATRQGHLGAVLNHFEQLPDPPAFFR